MKLKTIKTILATGMLSLSLAGLANAQGQGGVTYAYITGSTAFRNSVFNVIATNTFDSTPTYVGYGNSALSKCNYMIFSNTIGSVPYIIKCQWSGSEAGILDCASNILETFPGDGVLGTAGSFTAITSPSTPPAPIDSHQNDVGMADNSQSYSRTLKPSLTGTTVGVIPFTWIKNAQAPADLTGTLGTDWTNWVNLTQAQVDTAILDNGTPLSIFTGNAAETNFVYVAGRNNNSGTRANQLLDIALPVGQFVSQIYITGGSKTDHTVAITLENQSNLGINSSGKTYLGTDGQDSGGTLATTMNYLGSASQTDLNYPYGNTNACLGWFAVAYLGRSDANSVLGANGNVVEMLFNGVASTSANIESGVYPCWGNEWIYKAKNDSGNSTAQTTLYNVIVNHIVANMDGSTAIPYSSMHVYKQSSASAPVENGF